MSTTRPVLVSLLTNAFYGRRVADAPEAVARMRAAATEFLRNAFAR